METSADFILCSAQMHYSSSRGRSKPKLCRSSPRQTGSTMQRAQCGEREYLEVMYRARVPALVSNLCRFWPRVADVTNLELRPCYLEGVEYVRFQTASEASRSNTDRANLNTAYGLDSITLRRQSSRPGNLLFRRRIFEFGSLTD